MRIEYSRTFKEQLAAIIDFIASDKPSAARNWVATLFEKMERVASFPESGAKLRVFKGLELRQVWFGNYRIVYRVEDRCIIGLSISHGSRRIRAKELIRSGEEE